MNANRRKKRCSPPTEVVKPLSLWFGIKFNGNNTQSAHNALAYQIGRGTRVKRFVYLCQPHTTMYDV